MQEVAADVVSSVPHRRGGQAGSCGGRGRPTVSGSGRCLPDTSSRCRENLYPAGGPNGAKRSEFRRDGLPVGV